MKMKVTPEMAKEMLQGNKKNRPLSKTYVKKLARQMKKGGWDYNGESIKIAADGTILDGQHRLHAIVESGAEVETEVVFGLPNRVFSTIDIGKARTCSDVLSINNVKNYVAAAATCQALYALNKKRHQSINMSLLDKKSATEYYFENDHYIQSARLGSRYIGVTKKVASGCTAYLLQHNDHDEVMSFFEAFETGKKVDSDKPVDQAILLRETMIKSAVNPKSKMTPPEQAAKILKAFSNYKNLKNPPFIRWSQGANEPFPYFH